MKLKTTTAGLALVIIIITGVLVSAPGGMRGAHNIIRRCSVHGPEHVAL